MSCRAKSRCLVYKCVSFSGVLCHVKVSEDSKMGTHCICNIGTGSHYRQLYRKSAYVTDLETAHTYGLHRLLYLMEGRRKKLTD